MRQAKVIVISVSGLKGKEFKTGETVNERSFFPGHFDELLDGAYLEEIKPEEEKEEALVSESAAPILMTEILSKSGKGGKKK